MFLRWLIVVSLCAAALEIEIVTANPSAVHHSSVVISSVQLAKKLSSNAGDNSGEETSAETDSSSGDKSNENKSTEGDSAEIVYFSAKIVKTSTTTNSSSTNNSNVEAGGLSSSPSLSVSNIQKWEVPAPAETKSDQTVIYFLDDNGNVDMGNATIADLTIVSGNIACNNSTKTQFFRETDRCNGIYQCDDNGEDERNCPEKCAGFRYPHARVSGLDDCNAHIERYYYDFELQQCVMFAYGGCANVVNMFLSKAECIKECIGVAVTATTTTPWALTPVPAAAAVDVVAAAGVKVFGEIVSASISAENYKTGFEQSKKAKTEDGTDLATSSGDGSASVVPSAL